MKHRRNKLLELSTGVQKKGLVIRNLITSLVIHGKVVTTSKRAKVLKAEANSFFSSLVKVSKRYSTPEEGKREAIRLAKKVLFTEEAGKKAINDLLPKYINDGNNSFVTSYKMGQRSGDAAEKIMIKLI